jgi:hypothetical protein
MRSGTPAGIRLQFSLSLRAEEQNTGSKRWSGCHRNFGPTHGELLSSAIYGCVRCELLESAAREPTGNVTKLFQRPHSPVLSARR